MKSTIKLFLVIVIATSTTFADDGNMGNGGLTGDGNMGNGGVICTINCPVPPPPAAQSTTGTDPQATGDDGSVLTIIENYLKSLLG